MRKDKILNYIDWLWRLGFGILGVAKNNLALIGISFWFLGQKAYWNYLENYGLDPNKALSYNWPESVHREYEGLSRKVDNTLKNDYFAVTDTINQECTIYGSEAWKNVKNRVKERISENLEILNCEDLINFNPFSVEGKVKRDYQDIFLIKMRECMRRK
jgi:hypothetical protein